MRARVMDEYRFPPRLGRAPASLRRLFSGGTGIAPEPQPVPDTDDDDRLAASLIPDDSQNPIVRGLMNVLPLVEPEPGQGDPDRRPSAEAVPPSGHDRRDWTATLGLVQRAVAAVRASEERAVDLEVHAREAADLLEEERRVARGRIISAESRAEEAEFRAREAEAYAREVEIRVDELERELDETRARAKEAEARATEAETWLKRLHDALMDQAFANVREGEQAGSRAS